MRKMLLIAAFALLALTVRAQNDDRTVYTAVQHIPEFNGGIKGFISYLQSNVKYPKKAKDGNVQGRVIVQFIVEKDGSLSNVQAVRSSSDLLSDEAIRVIKDSPKWTPGKQGNKAVRTQFTVPVDFKLAANS